MLFGACSKEPEVDSRITVSFDWNINTKERNPEDIKLNPGDKYGELPNPSFTIPGYDFNGWNTRSDARGEFITEDSIVSEDATDHSLYAFWKGREYTVSFVLNGGKINGATEMPPRKVTFGKMYGAMVIPNNPEKKLSTFLGWYLNPQGEGSPITYSSIVRVNSDHTLYAVFKDLRVDYEFDSDAELEDFFDIYSSLTMNIEDHKLVLSNDSDNPRAYLGLNAPLKAGSVVDFDVEFSGEASVDDGVKTSFYTYGGNENGSIISSGTMGNPNVKETRDEIKQWYWGQGANNLEPWEAEEWNNGHMVYSMNILEDCSSVIMMIEFGRVAVLDENGEKTGDYVDDKTLWENNKWIINSIHLHPADYELVKSEYNFEEEDDIQSFVNPHNINYSIEDNALKVTKGDEVDEPSTFEFETQYLPAGSKVEYEVQFVGDQKYSQVGEVGINTYGLYPNGMKLNSKTTGEAIDADNDSPHLVKWFWGGYCINNNSWDPATLVNGSYTKFTTYIYEDCFGIQMMFKFGTSNGYFLINNIRVVQVGDVLSHYNFANPNQIFDFSSVDGLSYSLEEDDIGNYLQVQKGASGEGNLAINTVLKAGQKVYIDIELDTADESFESNPYTVLVHHSQYAGKRMDERTLAVLGTNSGDGGWDGGLQTLELTVIDDCYGLSLQLIFGQDTNASFKIRYIDIE